MVTIENLSFSYSRHTVFNNIDLTLEAGKIYGLLGQNGVGKTTLLKIIAGLLKLKSGNCNAMGYLPFNREPGFLGEMFYIPEDFIAPKMVVNQFARLRGEFYPKYDHNRFGQLLDEFEVKGGSSFTGLSYGQQKKAIIAFALSVNANLLLLDEPSNGLDIPSKSKLRKVVSEASNDDNCIVISTHQVRDMENLIDPIIILDRDGVLLNEEINRITGKLTFRFSGSTSPEALYCESTPGGYLIVDKNITGQETRVNIEALFNATLSHKDEMKKIFNK